MTDTPETYITKRQTPHEYQPTPYNARRDLPAPERGPFAIEDRGISESVVQRYGVMVERSRDTAEPTAHDYPYYSQEGGQLHKRRTLPKQFYADPSISTAQLFGQHLFSKGSAPSITVTEGELDAMAAFQMFDSKWPVVSVPSASMAKRAFKSNLEYLESFDSVVIAFDNDEHGLAAAKECAALLSPRKAKIFHHSKGFKDPCDYLKAKEFERYKRNWWAAETWVPEGIIAGSSLWERILNKKDVPSLTYPWPTLQAKTYGIRRGEMVVFCAPTNVGKTQVLREIEYHIFRQDQKAKIGAIFMEESVETSGLGLMSIHANKILHLPDTKYTPEELRTYYDQTLADDRIFYYNTDSGSNLEEVVNKIHYYAKALDCHYIFLDNFTILTTEHSGNNDERKRIDEAMGKLVKIAKELDVAFIAVAHLNREGQIRGSTAIENFAHITVFLDRDIKNPDADVRNTMNLTIGKNRFCGNSGPAGSLRYNTFTGRLEEMDVDYFQPVAPAVSQAKEIGEPVVVKPINKEDPSHALNQEESR